MYSTHAKGTEFNAQQLVNDKHSKGLEDIHLNGFLLYVGAYVRRPYLLLSVIEYTRRKPSPEYMYCSRIALNSYTRRGQKEDNSKSTPSIYLKLLQRPSLLSD